jgi:hypothetical protein
MITTSPAEINVCQAPAQSKEGQALKASLALVLRPASFDLCHLGAVRPANAA